MVDSLHKLVNLVWMSVTTADGIQPAHLCKAEDAMVLLNSVTYSVPYHDLSLFSGLTIEVFQPNSDKSEWQITTVRHSL